MRRKLCVCASVAIAIAVGCSDGSDSAPRSEARPQTSTPTEATTPADPEPVAANANESHQELVARGKRAYLSNCIACHSADPNKAGALGPDIADASLELLEARVLRGEYPAGYTPKRDTRAMIPLAYLERDIDALYAYLQRELER